MKKLVVAFTLVLVMITSTAFATWEIGDIQAQGTGCDTDSVDVRVEENDDGAIIKANFLDYFVETDFDAKRDSKTCNITMPVSTNQCGGCLIVEAAKWTGFADIAEGARGSVNANFYINADPGMRDSETFSSLQMTDFELNTGEIGKWVTGTQPVLLSADSLMYLSGYDSYIQMNTMANELAWQVRCCPR